MITEEVKKEADSIVEKYRPLADTWDCYHDTESTDKNEFKCAIQDRQSVLEAMTELLNSLQMSSKFAIQLRINNLNNQISYLKSKI